MEQIIVGLLRVLCPVLRDMAENSSNPVDDIVVNIICMIAGQNEETKLKEVE